MKYDDAVRLVDRLSARLTWLGNATATDAVTPATRAWLAAERDARIAELEAQLAASEDEKRRFQRMYGKASATIGAQRDTMSRLRADKALLTRHPAVTQAAMNLDPADTARVGDADTTPSNEPWCSVSATGDPADYWCSRRPGHAGQHVAGDGGRVLVVWPNTADADADAALVATAEHLGNEVGPDRTAAIEGAAITLRAHDPIVLDRLPDGATFTRCRCGYDTTDHARHVAEQLAAVGALGNLQLSVEGSPPDLLDRDGDRWRWVRSGYSRAVERPKTRQEVDLNWGPVRDADPEEVPF